MTQPDTQPEELTGIENHPLYQGFLKGEPVAYEGRLAFSCRGCGHRCCVDMEILLTPPEAARITWFLKRNPQLDIALRENNIQWGAMFIGGSTGLPLLRINFVPFNEQKPDEGKHCPFLAPVFGGNPQKPVWLNMAWCQIRQARPGPCRIYPVGRVFVGEDDADIDRPEKWQYRIVARCPGFEPGEQGQAVPPGYEPPDPNQTIRDWVAQQLDPEQEQEKNLYLHQVISAFMRAKMHVPTETSPGGLLTEDFAMFLGMRLLYNPPPPPSDPAQDHVVLMEWLEALSDLVPTIEQTWREAARPPGAQESAVGVVA